jgi:hypothetical protein
MKNIAPFNQISSIEKVIKKYFPSNEKLYSLTEDEVAMCGAAHDVDIMYMFNDRTWLDVWNDSDAFWIDYMIGMFFYSLTIPAEYYREINNYPKICSEENENNVRFFNRIALYVYGSRL